MGRVWGAVRGVCAELGGSGVIILPNCRPASVRGLCGVFRDGCDIAGLAVKVYAAARWFEMVQVGSGRGLCCFGGLNRVESGSRPELSRFTKSQSIAKVAPETYPGQYHANHSR